MLPVKRGEITGTKIIGNATASLFIFRIFPAEGPIPKTSLCSCGNVEYPETHRHPNSARPLLLAWLQVFYSQRSASSPLKATRPSPTIPQMGVEVRRFSQIDTLHRQPFAVERMTVP